MWKDENWVKTCGNKNGVAETYFSIMIVELGLIIVFVIAAILRCLGNSSSVNVNSGAIK
jgi:hypothetical protein